MVARVGRSTDELVLATLAAGPQAVVGFASAAHVHGWDVNAPPPSPQLITGLRGVRGGPYRSLLGADDVELLGILRVTTPRRTALDLAASVAFDEAVIALDSGLRSHQVTYDELTRYFETSRRPGVRGARRALAFADPRSGIVPETEARLLFAKAKLPPPATQYAIRCAERLVARLDFAWEFALLAAEIDGFAYHSASGEFQRDRTRQNAVQLDGWLVLRFTVVDIRHNPDEVVAAVRRGLARSPPSSAGLTTDSRDRPSDGY